MGGAVGMIGTNDTETGGTNSGSCPRICPMKRTILVVDDDPSIRNLIVEALRHEGDYIATEASDEEGSPRCAAGPISTTWSSATSRCRA
ncbi:MAG: response regulator [Desulfobacterales bacterium]|nr:response regulator [Desulfobacterales bacterium]